jgi:single-stranded-DNA-specific exonuclease
MIMKQYAIKDPVSREEEKKLNLEQYPELLRKLLIYRGITAPEEIEVFLNPNYETGLHDPYLMKDMDRAVERILKAVTNDEKILIYSDYDADGIPAAVIMHDYFTGMAYENFEVYIPHRHNEGFGLHLEAVEKFKESRRKAFDHSRLWHYRYRRSCAC